MNTVNQSEQSQAPDATGYSGIPDRHLRAKNLNYFENSRRCVRVEGALL
jgi:hypothetical protein